MKSDDDNAIQHFWWFNGDKENLQRNFWKRHRHQQQQQQQQQQQEQQWPQQQQRSQHKQSYITPWWFWRATADFVWQTTVWFGNLLKKINPSDDKKKSPHSPFFFYWSINSLHFHFLLKLQRCTDKHTRIREHFARVFVCVVTVAVPIQLNHHAKDFNFTPDQNGSQTIHWASWNTRPMPTQNGGRMRPGAKSEEPCSSCLCPFNKEATKILNQTLRICQLRPLNQTAGASRFSIWGLTLWRVQ